SLAVHPDVRAIVFIPPEPLSTELARGLLPTTVAHHDAAINSGRAALLVAAMTQRPDELLAATEDRLHQEFRRPAMTSSLDLVDALRTAGVAAVVSGAGPTVLALATSHGPVDIRAWCPLGWRGVEIAVDGGGAVVVSGGESKP
ncbi:MAG: homoserine kinase, partial [Nocardioidaceae bacterium]|nr:homoserine kinase [Nocardioidaceae bacterium]